MAQQLTRGRMSSQYNGEAASTRVKRRSVRRQCRCRRERNLKSRKCTICKEDQRKTRRRRTPASSRSGSEDINRALYIRTIPRYAASTEKGHAVQSMHAMLQPHPRCTSRFLTNGATPRHFLAAHGSCRSAVSLCGATS